MTDLYTSQTISGYNPDAPPDDGSQTASNLATYDQIKTELVDPVKTLAEAVNSQTNTAFETVANAFTAFGTKQVALGPSALESWSALYAVHQIGGNMSIYSEIAEGSSNSSNFANNAYYDGTNHKRISADLATRYYQEDGTHIWQYAGTGAADSSITWSNGLELLASGYVRSINGLLFGSDTAEANALDDYEEGSWTPTIQDTSLSDGEGQTYSVQVGRYTKIGNVVSVRARLTVTSIGTLTGGQGAKIGGLPFTSSSTANNYGSITVGTAAGMAITAGQNITGDVAPNTAYISLSSWESTAGTNSLTVTKVSATGDLIFSGIYQAV